MDLNNIDLPASTLAELFRSSLVIPVEKPLETVVPAAGKPAGELPAFKWLGSNKKNVLVLVRYADALYLPDKDLELLTSILTACKLSLEDVAILNLHHHPDPDQQNVIEILRPAKALLFGVDAITLGLPVSIPYFQIQEHHQTSYLSAPAIAAISEDRSLKTNLWNGLKRMFGL